ncbi:uncharacterized protein LOC110732964 [Chenopodium quinoa]|uniref:uncharacterized protein LOC110732964 n=1 Tax=Chenopodium quinoa TaxID=63459 RepID=UPI000B772E9D|nr:uncharacterized protein LOC110732964 [Chenopodium quinoa]
MSVDYWMKWQVPICGLIIVIPAAVANNLIKKRIRNGEDETHKSKLILWVPCWRNLNPKWLLLYRASAFITMAYLLYQMILFSGLFAFYFYTQWTFALVMVYFAIGTIISAQGCFMSAEKGPATSAGKDKFLKNDSDGNESAAALGSNKGEGSNTLQNHDSNDEAGGVGFLGSLMLIVYQISAGASMLTDLVFWCILVPMMAGKQFELTLLIGFIHSLNAVFLVIDSLLNALPFQWFGFTYFILWSVTYITFQWILHACGFTWWPYPFLELSTPWAPLWYLGMAVIHVPCYAVYIMLVKAKNSIFSKLFPRAFVRSHQWISHHQKAA